MNNKTMEWELTEEDADWFYQYMQESIARAEKDASLIQSKLVEFMIQAGEPGKYEAFREEVYRNLVERTLILEAGVLTEPDIAVCYVTDQLQAICGSDLYIPTEILPGLIAATCRKTFTQNDILLEKLRRKQVRISSKDGRFQVETFLFDSSHLETERDGEREEYIHLYERTPLRVKETLEEAERLHKEYLRERYRRRSERL